MRTARRSESILSRASPRTSSPFALPTASLNPISGARIRSSRLRCCSSGAVSGRSREAGRFPAVPGGFIRPTETVEEGARRELREETALVSDRLIPVGVFSKPDRDMRAWIISNAFVSFHKRGEGVHVKGGDDASEAKWLTVKSPTIENGRFYLPFYDVGAPGVCALPRNGRARTPAAPQTPRDGRARTPAAPQLAFCISGTYREEEFGGGTVLSVGDSPLAFDHAEIIAQAFLRMLSFDIKKLVFFFLPEKFTLSNYIDIYQYLTRYSIEPSNIPNFRRQLTATKDPLLEVCEGEMETLDGRAHAPAKLYRRRSSSTNL